MLKLQVNFNSITVGSDGPKNSVPQRGTFTPLWGNCVLTLLTKQTISQ